MVVYPRAKLADNHGMTPGIDKLAKILRTKEEILDKLVIQMSRITPNSSNVLENVLMDLERRADKALLSLNLSRDAKAEDVYMALLKRVEENDLALNKYLKKPDPATREGCETLANFVKEVVGETKGFFMKQEKAEEFLKKNPPKNLLRALGYNDIDQLLAKEDFAAVFSSVRFAEEPQWLNEVFFKPYENLTPDDFEERLMRVIVLPERWRAIGAHFMGKKLHNISHLKELGVIFVIPIGDEGISLPEIGEINPHKKQEDVASGITMQVFTLLLHYFFEIGFYSRLFTRYSKEEKFAEKLVSALRGDVPSFMPAESSDTATWMVIQRYLAKDTPSDPRLFMPHVNPEAIHWSKAEQKLVEVAQAHPEFGLDLWPGLDFVGGFFNISGEGEFRASGIEGTALLSFDLIDNLISYNRFANILTKYLYHQQEALWNKIFIEYTDASKLEELVAEHLADGFIKL